MRPPRRILLLNYEFPPMGGGAGHASANIARSLVREGCAVDVVTSRVGSQPAMELIDGFRVYRVPSMRRNIQECGLLGAWSYVASARAVCRRLIRDNGYDVIHYFFGLPTGVLSLLVPEARRIPSVVSLRGSDVPGYDADHLPLRIAHALLAPVTRRIWRRAGAVIANSSGLRALAQQAAPEVPIGVIPNAIDGEAFHPAADRARDAQAPLRLLTVARLIRRKGIHDLLRAMALLPDVPLHLTVQGAGGRERELRALSRRLGLEARVTFSGFLDRQQLLPVYQAADLFVLASHSESCAMALLEAMACGLPVVATNVGGMGELVQDGVHGLLVPPQDPDALAAALRRLAGDPGLRRAIAERNAATVRERHAWDRVAAAYLAVYRGVMRQDAEASVPAEVHAHA